MAWVNLNDVYVNKTGGTITGNLAVNGSITVNNGKGNGGTYNVANEITTLQNSVSQKLNGLRLFAGSKVVTVGAGLDSVVVFSKSDFKNTFGRTFAQGSDYIGFMNGDEGANNAHVEGSSLANSTGEIYAVLNKTSSTAAELRINYIVALKG